MDEERSRLRLFLFRLIPTVLLASLVGWCSSGNRARQEAEPIRTELAELFQSEGLIDTPINAGSLSDAAKKLGQPGLNRLLYAAAPAASLDALKWLVKNGADPKNVGTLKDLTLLQQVAKVPRYDRLEYFLALGLDPTELGRDGRNLLHVAAAGGMDERVLKLLLDKGLRLDSTTPSGASAMHFASVKSIPVLVSAGLKIDSVDEDQKTALHHAASRGASEIATELIRSNASVFAADKRGRTPLHLASMARASPVIDALLAAGAPRTARDADGNTPRDLYKETLRGRSRHGSGNDILDKL